MGRELIFWINATADESAAEESTAKVERKKKISFRIQEKRQKAAFYLAGRQQ